VDTSKTRSEGATVDDEATTLAPIGVTKRRVPNSTTRVVMAFPFSSLRISGDATASRDLALLVADLCDALADEAGPELLRDLGERADALAKSFVD
jgi:hypothetical protein